MNRNFISNLNPIHITTISISMSLLLAGFLFFTVLDMYLWVYDPDWRGLLHEKNIGTEKILIIGSSQVQPINSTYVSEFLRINGQNYEIYNLADPGQLPDKRLRYLDNVISAEPSMVFYGIGMHEFQKNSNYEISEAIQSKDQFQKILDPQNFFWYTSNFFTDENFAIGGGASPKDKTVLFLKFLINGPDYIFHPFMKYTEKPIKELDQITTRDFSGFDLSQNNKQVVAVDKIVSTLQKHDIPIVIFSVPNVGPYLDQISDEEIVNYELFLNKISKQNNVYFLHDKYSDMNIWRDSTHIAINKNTTIYTEDMSRIILDEIHSRDIKN
jgi:hypothetical protein